MEEIFEGEIAFDLDGQRVTGPIALGENEVSGILVTLEREDDLDVGGLDIIRIDTRGKELELFSLKLDIFEDYEAEDRILVNGFQSWTDSREYTLDEKLPRFRGPAPKLMNLSGDYTFFPATGQKGEFHSHGHTYIRRDKEYTLWMDHLPRTGYTIFEHKTSEYVLRVHKDVGGLKVKGEQEIYRVERYQGKENEVFDQAFQSSSPRVAKAPVSGWTSWYYHYTDIDEEVILDNLKAFGERRIPIDFFQIDDGWQQAIGDWEANEKFPQGMAHISKSIHDQGYQAGLWLAPFIVDQKSKLFENHKDWLVSFDGENFMPGGFNPGWGGLFNGYYYVLDIYLEEVQEYLRQVFDQVLNQWNFDLVKLDFLYAVAIRPRNGKSRAAIMNDAMDLLRKWCGDKKILGCGVPLASVHDKVEYCRIGADVGPNWDNKALAVFNLRERISTRNSLHSTISRRVYSRRAFLNDPDVYMLRKEKCKLNEDQQHTLFLLNLTLGDLVFTSDDLERYDTPTLRKYQSQFPNFYKETESIVQNGDTYEIRFTCKNFKYVLVANLGSKRYSHFLPEGLYYNQYTGFLQRERVDLKGYQSRVFLIIDQKKQTLLGSTGHLIPGMDVDHISWKDNDLNLTRHPLALPDGEVLIRVPEGATEVTNHGANKKIEEIAGIRFVRAF